MPIRIISAVSLFGFIFATVFLRPVPAISQEESPAAREMMVTQIEALKSGNYQKFIENGNSAFKELSDTVFEVLEMSWSDQLVKGYRMDYLGAIERVGMTEHLWRVTITGGKSEHLGRLTLAEGKIAGFNLD